MDYLSFLLCLALSWITLHFLLSKTKRTRESNATTTPPGPPPIPIFGNLFSLGSKPHISLAELAKTYGPVMTLHLGQVPTVVISSAAAAKQVLQKNDLSFSTRNVPDGVHALNHHQSSVVWLPVCSKWRNLRKLCNTLVLSARNLEATQDVRRNKVKDLVSHVRKCSEAGVAVDIGQFAFTTTLNLLSNTFFSVDLGDPSSQISREFRHNVQVLMEWGGKPNIADYFPVLKKMDPQGVRRRMSIYMGKVIDLFNSIIEQRLQDKKPSSTCSEQPKDVLDALLGLNQEKPEEIELTDIHHLLVDLFGAGTDTTANSLEWAMAELLRNPETLKKAQEELQTTIGKGNPIEEPDTTRLPYLQAVIKETLRLHPPAPFLIPRKADLDVTLSGFTVPKNAQILVNAWAIGRDPEIWENPNLFLPERFLGSEIDVRGRDFELIPFGAGRRICPGMPLAIRMLHLMLGTLIHEFSWEIEGGKEKDLDMEEKFGITLQKVSPLRAIPTVT